MKDLPLFKIGSHNHSGLAEVSVNESSDVLVISVDMQLCSDIAIALGGHFFPLSIPPFQLGLSFLSARSYSKSVALLKVGNVSAELCAMGNRAETA